MPGGALETEQSMTSTGPSSMFVGKKLDEHRGSFLLEYPMDKGHIVDGGWDAMEALWEVRDDAAQACMQDLLLMFLFFFFQDTDHIFFRRKPIPYSPLAHLFQTKHQCQSGRPPRLVDGSPP